MLKGLFGLVGSAKWLDSFFVDRNSPGSGRSNPNQEPGQMLAEKYREAFGKGTATKVTKGSASIDNLELIIGSAYKQVFGNTHLMESECLSEAESQLRNGNITVREFVRCLAKSDRYRDLFWDKYPNVTVVELNFKHLLGRAPESYAEVSAHIQILAEGGFEAEIDSYIDSDEYLQIFGNDQVPCLRGYDTRVGGSVVGFMHAFPVFGTACSSELSIFNDGKPKLQANLAQGLPSEIPAISALPELISKPLPPKPSITKKRKRITEDLSFNTSTAVAPPLVRPPASVQIKDGQVQVWSFPEDKAKTLAEKYRGTLAENTAIELIRGSASLENIELVIRAAYIQVFGNAHVMESERLSELESQLSSGNINVSEFIRQLAKSDLYHTLFWDKYPNVTVVELNFKHLLGRAPESHTEVSEHIQILAEGGFEAEIDSYIDSDEYFQVFGNDQVPYLRGYDSMVGKNAVGFMHAFPLFGTACGSEKSNFSNKRPKLQANLAKSRPSQIPELGSIPESFPEALIIGPEPNIPIEIRNLARQLWVKIEKERALVPFP